jgi:dTDP-4-amino-4,6-dideoxygalactose transaminase
MSIVHSKPTITRKELESVLDCLINDELTTGDAIKIFESELSALLGMQHSLATNSLTSVFHLCFKALNIQAGDEVIIPSYFSLAPLSALSLLNATPVLVDISESSFSPSFEQIKEKVTDKTKAIVIGHTSGITSSFEKIKELNIPIIEDISHAIGSEIDEKPVGSTGTIAVCSFSPFDIITTGNGGAALTNNSRLFSVMKELRSNKKSLHFDYTMTDFQGAMGLSQLSHLKDFIRRRQEIAKIFYDRIRLTPHKPLTPYNENFTYQVFPIIFDAPADKISKYWKKNGIEIYHPIEKPLHAYLELKPMDYPNSDRMSKKVFSLPLYPTLTGKEIDKISRILAKFI